MYVPVKLSVLIRTIMLPAPNKYTPDNRYLGDRRSDKNPRNRAPDAPVMDMILIVPTAFIGSKPCCIRWGTRCRPIPDIPLLTRNKDAMISQKLPDLSMK